MRLNVRAKHRQPFDPSKASHLDTIQKEFRESGEFK